MIISKNQLGKTSFFLTAPANAFVDRRKKIVLLDKY